MRKETGLDGPRVTDEYDMVDQADMDAAMARLATAFEQARKA